MSESHLSVTYKLHLTHAEMQLLAVEPLTLVGKIPEPSHGGERRVILTAISESSSRYAAGQHIARIRGLDSLSLFDRQYLGTSVSIATAYVDAPGLYVCYSIDITDRVGHAFYVIIPVDGVLVKNTTDLATVEQLAGRLDCGQEITDFVVPNLHDATRSSFIILPPHAN